MADNPFDQFDTPSESSSNPFDQFDEAPAPRKPAASAKKSEQMTQSSILDTIKDAGRGTLTGAADLYRGIVTIPNMVLDIPANLHNAISPSSPPWRTATQMQNQALEADLARAGITTQNDPSRSMFGQIMGAVNRGVGSALTGIGAGSALAGATSPIASGVGQALASNPGTQLASAATGAASSDLARQAGAPWYLQLAAGLVGGAVPPLASARLSSVPATTPKGQVLEDAQKLGYVVPPGETGNSPIGSTLESGAGKIKTEQLASAKNQELTQELIPKILGLPAGTPATIDTLKAFRAQQAATGYAPVRAAGTMTSDAQLASDLSNAAAPSANVLQNFPGLSNPTVKAAQDVIDTASALSNAKTFDASGAVDTIQSLRDSATNAFRDGNSRAGEAYKQMAKALEDSVERNLSSRGTAGKSILDSFKSARTSIAKAFQVEDALSGSSVDARALARALDRGEFMTGELKTIAKFAQDYPKTATVPTSSVLPFSPLDYTGAAASMGTALATSNPRYALLAAYLASRPAMRSFILSPIGQKLLTTQSPAPQIPYAAVPGIVNPAVQGYQQNQ